MPDIDWCAWLPDPTNKVRTAVTASGETSGRAESWMQTTEAPSFVWLKPLNTESCRSLPCV